MLAGAPNLHRTVAECTQPYCAPSPAAVRALQKYLTDERCIDLVYLAVLSRAAAQPISEAVISKCAALIKQNLHRHTPSRGVLLAVQAGARRLAASLPSTSDVSKSLLFLATSAARLSGGELAGVTGLGPTPALARSSAPVNDSHSAASSEAAGGGDGAQWAGGGVGGASLRGSRQGLSALRGDGRSEADAGAEQEWDAGSLLEEELHAMGAVRPVVGQDGGPPRWALAPEDLPWPHLAAAAADSYASEGGAPGGAAQVDWAELVPEYGGSLAPLLQGMYSDEGGALPALECADILASFSDVDPEVALDQMLDIAAARREQMGAGAELLLEAAASAPRRAPPGPVPYCQQPPLDALSPADLAAVVEVVAGRAGGAAAPSAVSGRWEEEDPAAHWRPPAAAEAGGDAAPGNGGAGGGGEEERLGQVCGCVLAKLVIDTWLSAGPEASAPLVLRLLQQALHHASPAVRARAFDVIYNLSIHGALLGGAGWLEGEASRPGTPGAAPPHAGGGGSGGSPSGGPAAGIAPPSAPPEPEGRLYARPQSPHGAQRPRGGAGAQVPALASPRIHMPPGVMGRGGPGSSGSSGSGGGTSPRSPLSLGPPAAGSGGVSPPQPSPMQPLSSPRSRLGRGGAEAAAAVPLESPRSAGRGAAAEGAGAQWGALPGSLELEFEGWLRQLLFELLCMLSELEERSEHVWQSAAGCLLHLTTAAGYWVRDSAAGLPPRALRGLLRACLAHNWAPELHARLCQLAPLLLCPLPPGGRRATGATGAGTDGGASAGYAWSRRGTDGSAGRHTADGSAAWRLTSASDGAGTVARGSASGGCGADCGGVDAGRLAEFGGEAELLHHFCRASSPEAQRCMLLPLLELCIPPGTAPAAAGLAAVALAGTPARLRALQAALWGGRPGLADPIMTALGTAPQHGGAPELQLVCSVVLRLEGIATAGGSAAGGDVHSGGGSADGGGKGRGAGAGAAAARWSAAGGRAGSGGGGADGDGAAASVEAAAPDAAVAGAAELTRWQVAGELPEYQAAAAAAAWRALRELCWCPEPPARGAAARWLQQLLAAALEHASEGSHALPLPPGPDAAAPPQPHPDPGMGALAEALAHIVGHCPAGPDILLDALQLHLTAARAWPQAAAAAAAAARASTPGSDDGGGDPGGDAAAAAADMRAAASAARAWAFALQWVLRAAPRASCRAALARLAGLATTMLCWPPKGGAPSGAGTLPPPLASEPSAASAGTPGGGPPPARMSSSPQLPGGPPPAGPPPPAAGGGAEWGGDGGGGDDDGGAPDGVCRPQAFLMGRQLLSQEALVALGPESLSSLVARMLATRRPPSAASRGFTTRLELGPGPTVLSPASEAGADLQLSLLLFLVAAATGDEAGYEEAGLEPLARQVLASGLDPRACYYLSAFVLEHLMRHQQGRYWQALRQLLARAQAAEDERLLGNPFLQLQALFGA